MVLLLSILGVLVGMAGALYLVVGRNRYGGVRPPEMLQLGANASALSNGMLKPEPCRTVRVYFIKPSRYDDEGYVHFFRYGVQPNNTLTVLKALNEGFNRRYSAERNVYLETVIWDEICDGIVSPESVRAIKEKAAEDGVELLIGLAGVQSNQYPRGRDLGLQFVAQGVKTMMGGFHVSGYPESRAFLNGCGITTIVGEAENLWGEIIEDFLRGELKLAYAVTEGIRAKTGQDDIIVPVITDAHLPVVDNRHVTRMPVHVLVLQRQERDGAHDAVARARRGGELGARRVPQPWNHVAVPGRRRLLPQSPMGRDSDGPGRGKERISAARVHDAGRRRRVLLR